VNSEERKLLLRDLTTLDYREAENAPSLKKVFLPLPAHSMALRQEIVIVRGGRGVGKSALFQMLSKLRTTDEVRAYFGDTRLPQATWIDAFSQNAVHPQDTSLDAFAQNQDEVALRAFWMAHLLLRLAQEMPGVADPPENLRALWSEHLSDPVQWVPIAQQSLGVIASGLDRFERALDQQKQLVFATYDHLDRLGTFQPLIRRKYVASLLSLWLSLSNRYRQLRAKIFLREDLLDAGELGFPDASKLRARSISIDWDVESVYRVAVRHMANTSKELRSWIQSIKGGVSIRNEPIQGWMPGPMPPEAQKAFADHLAGEIMGTGANKGYTYRWIPNHLQDSNRQVVPRSLLVLLGVAAGQAMKQPLTSGHRLLTTQDLVNALDETSRRRVGEIQEEYKLVNRLKHLENKSLLFEESEVIRLIAKPVDDEPPGLSTDGRAVLEELLRLGVATRRTDGRIDIPDIYRYGFKILRKGGVARPR
jgi:hypothetical protein